MFLQLTKGTIEISHIDPTHAPWEATTNERKKNYNFF